VPDRQVLHDLRGNSAIPHAAEVTVLILNRPIAAVLAALATSGVFVFVDYLFSYAAR